MKSKKYLSNSDLLYAMQQRNLVYNYNFLNYSNKTLNTIVTYGLPDGWVYQDGGTNGAIGFDPTSNSCMINKSAGNASMTLTQTISEFPRWMDTLSGQTVSACAVITIPGNTGCQVTFSINDGQNTSSKLEFFSPGERKKIMICLDISSNANTLAVSIGCNASGAVLYISKVYCNIGKIALENLPCIVEGTIGERKQYMSTQVPPVTELSLCAPSVELSSSYTRLNSFLNGKFGVGANRNSLLPDMRGYFSRAWNNGAAIDPDASSRTALGSGAVIGDNVGTVEQDQFKQHTHQLLFAPTGQIPAGPSTALPSINVASGSQTEVSGGAETRGKNISELYTMKWA